MKMHALIPLTASLFLLTACGDEKVQECLDSAVDATKAAASDAVDATKVAASKAADKAGEVADDAVEVIKKTAADKSLEGQTGEGQK